MKLTIKYHDIVLLGIIGSLLLGVVVGLVSPVPITVSVPIAAILGFALIYQTIFIGGPVDSPNELSEEAQEIEILE